MLCTGANTKGVPRQSCIVCAERRLRQALALDPDHRVSRWPPGSQHVYSNMTAGLTQLLIETIAGMPYAAAAEHYALRRLGMENAGFSPLPDLPGGYQADGTSKIPYWHMTYPAYGALNASLADMNQLLLHWLMEWIKNVAIRLLLSMT